MIAADWQQIERELAESLSKPRFRHSQETAEMAKQLAQVHGVDPERAYRAGLLHDCCREWSKPKLLDAARQKGLLHESWEEAMPGLLHGPVGAWYIKSRWGIDDSEIGAAIAFHTLGRAGMGALEKIIFLADKLERTRRYPGVEELRQLALADLDKALLKSLEQSMIYVLQKGQFLHPQAVAARNHLVLTPKSEEENS